MFNADTESEQNHLEYDTLYGEDEEYTFQQAPELSGLSFYDFIVKILKTFPRRARGNRDARKTEAVTHNMKCGSDPAHAVCTPAQRRQKGYKGKNWRPDVTPYTMQDNLTATEDEKNVQLEETRSERQHLRRLRK
jgi:hypothetical protein